MSNITRNQLISELFYEEGERSATIASMEKQTLITKYPHLYSKHKEYVDSCESYLFPPDRKNGRGHIGEMMVHNICAANPIALQTEMTSVEEVNYIRKPNMSLDDELSQRLMEPDLNKFLLGCGYKTTPLHKRDLHRKSSGFGKLKHSGIIYVVLFTNTDINNEFEFIKYGITSEATHHRRTQGQLSAAKREGFKYEAKTLLTTKELNGELIRELETKLDGITRHGYKVPKSHFPDGYSETTSLDMLYDIQIILEPYLNYINLDE